MLNWSQRHFAHVKTITLSWRVQNFVENCRVYFKPEHGKFWPVFEFDRNIVSWTGAWFDTGATLLGLSTWADDSYTCNAVWVCWRFNYHMFIYVINIITTEAVVVGNDLSLISVTLLDLNESNTKVHCHRQHVIGAFGFGELIPIGPVRLA